MDELMAKLQGILSTPQGMDQLKNIAQSLGIGNNGGNAEGGNATSGNATNGMDISALASMLGGIGGNGGGSSTDGGNGGSFPPIDMGMIMGLQQLFQSMNQNDKNTQLLQALKPHFSEKRKARVDQAISMMRLLAMLPALKESGIFSGL